MLLIVQILASLAMLLVFAGLIQRTRAKQHVRWMMMAFVADMLGLLLVELPPLFDPDRIDPVSALADSFSWKHIHALFATLALVGYILQIRSGRRIQKGDRSLLPGHKKVAVFFLISRVAAYATMWMMGSPV